jgi:hypothetical protein
LKSALGAIKVNLMKKTSTQSLSQDTSHGRKLFGLSVDQLKTVNGGSGVIVHIVQKPGKGG